jgi:cell division septum initiation protein DivIVA
LPEHVRIRQAIHGIKQEIGRTKQEIDGSKQEIAGNKRETGGIKQEIQKNKREIDRIKREIHGNNRKIRKTIHLFNLIKTMFYDKKDFSRKTGGITRDRGIYPPCAEERPE